MSLTMINKDKLTAAIMLNMMLLTALFVVTVLTISLYADNKQNQKNILAAQAPISVTIDIGVAPHTLQVERVAAPSEVTLPNPVNKKTTVLLVDK